MVDDGDRQGQARVLSRRIAAQVRSAILSGELKPGDRIRQEDLADEFGASRFPVREALRILETTGLVTTESNRGAWVTRLSQAECTELYLMREQLEPLLLEDSTTQLDDAVMGELSEILSQLEAVETIDPDRYLELDWSFHQLTYSGSQMQTVRSEVERLVERTHYYRRAYLDLVRATQSRIWILEYDHRLILDAIQRRDSYEAGSVMRLHTRRASMALLEHPEIFA
ncbi:MAG: GntR family transcriptional regulator [Beutenbergiaceae bacterium]